VAQSWTAIESTLLARLRTVTGLALKVSGADRSIRISGGPPIFIRTADAPEYMDGLDVGWLVGDELRHWSRKAYDIAISRVRVPCPLPQRAFASTPAVGWMSQEFDTDKPGRNVVFGSTSENAHNLADGYVANLEASWSPRMQQAALHGQFVVLEGAVYDAFDHSIRSPWIEEYDAERWSQTPAELWVDPGYRRASVLWVRPHPTRALTWVVFDQLMPEDQSMERTVEQINAANRLVGDIVVDPAAGAKDQATEVSVRDVLKQIRRVGRIRAPAGYYRGIAWGTERVRATLGDPAAGVASRLVFSRQLCESEGAPRVHGRGIMRSLASLRYPEARDGRAIVDEPLKDGVYDHAVDSLRYGVVLKWLTTPLRQLLASADRNLGPGHTTLA
jgi:hypothetical protein